MNAMKLRPGDTVFWTDPDDGACSRLYKIKAIEHRDDDTVKITDIDGSVLECYEAELSVQSEPVVSVEYIRAYADGTWDTEMLAVPNKNNMVTADRVDNDALVEWYHEFVPDEVHAEEVSYVGVYSTHMRVGG